jgi:DNA-nicking Smr family endonuclease
MKPAPDVEDLRLWAVVAATVRPLRPHPAPAASVADRPTPAPASAAPSPPPRPPAKSPHPFPAPRLPADVEAGLRRRLSRGREALVARIDLHGMSQDAARAALAAFIARAADEGWRSALVITGKGVGGDGVLRRRAPEWLADPPIRQHIAGVSEAHRRHGGEGALYVALKRQR